MRVVVTTFAIAIAGTLGLAGAATGVAPTEALPDMVSDAPTGDVLQVYVDANPTVPQRLLLRFNGYVHNKGTGALEMVGRGPVNLEMTQTAQRIYDTGGVFLREDATRDPVMLYETADGHNHWHLRAAMRYALYDQSKTVEVAPSQKVGFCLIDSERIETNGPASKVYVLGSFCERYNTTAPSVTMGISPGWRDIYGSGVAFQWVDVSDVRPGTYWIGASSDPDNVVIESNEANNGVAFAASASIVPGYVAQPVSVSAVAAGQPRTVTLSAQLFGGGGARKFRITSAPARGTLDQPVGQAFDGPDVTYTPGGSYSGSDSFTYEALDANSAFPRTPARATVTLTSSGNVPTVAISGAPASMVAGTSVQLAASVTGSSAPVQWSVNGVVGGTTGTGTITSGGLYTAPSTPPTGGSVRIRAATSSAGAEVTIAITALPPPTPAPSPTPSPTPAPTPAPAPSPAPAVAPPLQVAPAATPVPAAPLLPPTAVKRTLPVLAAPVLARRGNLLVIGALSRRAGTVEVTAWKGSSRLGRCVVLASASRSLTCQVRVGSSLQVTGLRVTVRLLVGGKAVALRRATFTRQIAGPRTPAIYRGAGLECWLSTPTR